MGQGALGREEKRPSHPLMHLAKPPSSGHYSFPGQLVFSHSPQAWPQAIDLGSDAYSGGISADAILIRL